MEESIRVLVVDGDSGGRNRTVAALESAGVPFAITTATTGASALATVESGEIDCLVSSFDLPGMDGLDLFEQVNERTPDIPFVLFPETGSEALASEAFEAGVADYLPRTEGTYTALAHRLGQAGQNAAPAKLARERERFLDLFENFPEPTLAYGFDDGGTVFRSVNDAFEAVFGLDVDTIRGQPVNEFIVPEERRPESEDIDQKVESGELVDRVVRRLAADRPRIFNLRNIPVTTGGAIDGFAVYTDITERKERERELERQNERLEEFASIVSHDLRNPLNVAMGHLEIVRQESESDSLENVTEALERMEVLIGETLQLAKQGQMVTETKVLTLTDLAAGCWEMVENREASLETVDDLVFRADPSRMKQLLENMFRNAIDHGGEDVLIRVGPLDEGFYIEDDGPGIPSDERDEIFEAGHTTSDDGTGFGLAIVNEIIDAHDWEITVTESEIRGVPDEQRASRGREPSPGARFEITGVDLHGRSR